MQFYITHLYPRHLSLYGDMGNVHAMRWHLEQLGIEVIYQPVELGDPLPNITHWYFIGGGQDKQQMLVSSDLCSKGQDIIQDITRGVPLLAICGGYQLLGKEFVTGTGEMIPGVGLFPVITKALDTTIHSRSIGDVVITCSIPELTGTRLVGFENHSGQTYFDNQNITHPSTLSQKSDHDDTTTKNTITETQHIFQSEPSSLSSPLYPLGTVLVGKGNNCDENHEGCVVNHAVGTYLHGSCLPKNPELTEWFINAGMRLINPDFEDATTTPQNTSLHQTRNAIALQAKQDRLTVAGLS